MIDFELSVAARAARDYYRRYAEEHMRPISREFDEREHERPWDFIRHAWEMSRSGEAPALTAEISRPESATSAAICDLCLQP